MIIKLIEQYKSLSPFTSPELKGLVVITGKNGSGKTQFIELFQKWKESSEKSPIEMNPPLWQNQIQIEGVQVISVGGIGKETWRNTIWDYVNKIANRKDLLKYVDILEENIIDWKRIADYDIVELLTKNLDIDSQNLKISLGRKWV